MYSIKEEVKNEMLIKKSRFITYLYKINFEKNVKNKLQEVKKKHKDANHICYAYKLESIVKCSDGGEPTGSAGLPILNILKQNNLNYILCVVVRYFGGIKLGTGGLIRAYAGSAKEGLLMTTIIELIKGKHIEIKFSYENSKQIEYLLQETVILNKSFDEEVSYRIEVSRDIWTLLQEKLIPYCLTIQDLENILIEKKNI